MDPLSGIITAFDLLLAGLLIAVAFGALMTRDLFKSVMLFVTLGLLLALTWVRLAAPDVALAEAAIGSGLAGALLLAALDRLRALRRRREGTGDD